MTDKLNMATTLGEMIEVMQAYMLGKDVQNRKRFPRGQEWVLSPDPTWNWDVFEYRVAPKTADSINWDHVASEYICMKRGEYHGAFLFKEHPRYPFGHDHHSANVIVDATAFRSYKKGTVDWKDSLVWRPGHEPGE